MNKEIAIIDASTGSVEIHTLPHHVHNSQDELEDYLTLTLEVTSDQQWITELKQPHHENVQRPQSI